MKIKVGGDRLALKEHKQLSTGKATTHQQTRNADGFTVRKPSQMPVQ